MTSHDKIVHILPLDCALDALGHAFVTNNNGNTLAQDAMAALVRCEDGNACPPAKSLPKPQPWILPKNLLV